MSTYIDNQLFSLRTIILLMLGIIYTQTSAQLITDTTNRHIISFTTKDGLPDDFVSRVLIDNIGFVWLVTNSSVVRYDGIQFKRYPLNNERIVGFFESFTDDSIYVQTSANGFYTIYNGKIASNNWIKNANNIALIQSKVIHSLNANAQKAIAYLKHKNLIQDDIIAFFYNDFFPVTDSTFFCRATNRNCFYFNGSYFSNCGPMAASNNTIDFVNKNSLYCIDLEHKKVCKSSGKHFEKVSLSENYWDIFAYHNQVWKKGNHYFLSDTAGYKFTEQRNTITLQKVFSDPTAIQVNDFKFCPKNDVFFIATTNGLNILQKKYFHHITSRSGKNIVRAFIGLKKDVWIVPENFISNHTTGLNATKMDPKGLFIDKKQNLFYTYNSKLHYYNHLNKTNTIIDSFYREMSHMTYDAKNQLWLSGPFSIFRYQNNKPVPVYNISNRNATISKFLFLGNNQVLIATSKGLIVTDFKAEKILLPNIEFRELFDDGAYILVGTYGHGAYLFNKKTQKLTRLPNDKQDCLNHTHAFLLDSNNFFWISTNKGIIRVHRKDIYNFSKDHSINIHYYSYDKNDGLETLEMNGASSPCAASYGDKFYFSSMKGIVSFNPYEIPLPMYTTPVIIEEIWADGNKIDGSEKLLNMPSNTKQVRFMIASPSIISAQNSEICYRIKQLDTNWITLNRTRTIDLLGLPNGKYELELKKTQSNESQINKLVKQEFRIELFYYQMVWFKIVVSIMLLLLVLAVITIRGAYLQNQNQLLNKKVIKQTEKLVKINQQNDILISVLAHDIRSPIKSMEFLASYIIKKLPHQSELKDHTKALLRSIKTIETYSTNHLNWYNLMKGALVFEDTVIDIHKLVSEALLFHCISIENKEIVVTKSIEKDIIFNSSYNGLLIILHNLIDNAVKHSVGNYLNITVKKDNEGVLIEVRNMTNTHNHADISANFNYIQSINWDEEIPQLNKELGLVTISYICNKLNLTLSHNISDATGMLSIAIGIKTQP